MTYVGIILHVAIDKFEDLNIISRVTSFVGGA